MQLKAAAKHQLETDFYLIFCISLSVPKAQSPKTRDLRSRGTKFRRQLLFAKETLSPA